MSGGAYDYAHNRVAELAETLQAAMDELELTSEQRIWRQRLIDRLDDLVPALRAVEWVDSGDTAPGSEVTIIKYALDAMPTDRW